MNHPIYSWGSSTTAVGQFWQTCSVCQRGFPSQDPLARTCGCDVDTDPVGVEFIDDYAPPTPKTCTCGAKSIKDSTHSSWCDID